MAKDCKKHFSPNTVSYYRFFARALRLQITDGYEPKEVFTLGLFNSKLDENQVTKYASLKSFYKVQFPLCPLSWRYMVLYKDLFYKYCQSMNLPVPELYAILNRNSSSISYKLNAHSLYLLLRKIGVSIRLPKPLHRNIFLQLKRLILIL
jgi:hypothetical protein